MASLVPPLDFIPKIPGTAVNKIVEQIDIQADKLLDQVSTIVQDSIKLPINIKCDDPRIEKMKNQLAEIQDQVQNIQESIPKIQTAIDSVKQVVTVAIGIKATISAAQLSNPVTAPVFIATQLMAIQDATIVNALAALNQFATVPSALTSKLKTIVSPLLAAMSKMSNACNGELGSIELPSDLLVGTKADGLNGDYNDRIDTEFYNEENVSDADLSSRSITIQDLVTQQRNLLTSLQEAPSKVYQQPGVPAADLGKLGDYYIDTTTSKIYGPKLAIIDWGTPVN
jgi:DNA-binding protein YbaB